MAEERYNTSHHAGATPEERTRNRLRPSAEPQRSPNSHQVKLGEGPTRAVTTVHPNANARQHGEDRQGVDIYGRPRASANPHGEIK